jgi:hypothetical protein
MTKYSFKKGTCNFVSTMYQDRNCCCCCCCLAHHFDDTPQSNSKQFQTWDTAIWTSHNNQPKLNFQFFLSSKHNEKIHFWLDQRPQRLKLIVFVKKIFYDDVDDDHLSHVLIYDGEECFQDVLRVRSSYGRTRNTGIGTSTRYQV